MKERIFQFKQFAVRNERSAMKVGTDGVLLGAWCNVENAMRVLDVGSGCGLISLMIAQRTVSAIVTGVEIDNDAYEESAENVANSPWQNRVSMVHNSFADFYKNAPTKYDLIVSNPPFYENALAAPDAQRNKARQAEALPPDELFSLSAQMLTDNGLLSVIYPAESLPRLKDIASNCGLYPIRIALISGRESMPPKRVLAEFGKISRDTSIESFAVYQQSGKHTEEYINLTHNFYLKMP